MTDPLAERVVQILADHAGRGPGDIRQSDTPESLGLDSLNLVEAVFALEEAFDIRIPFSTEGGEDGGFDVSSVAQVITGVRALVGDGAP